MNLLQINYQPEDEDVISDISVRMTFQEAVGLVNLLGTLNGYAHKKLNIDSDMYDCISSVMNKQFDSGAPNLHITLNSLNDE